MHSFYLIFFFLLLYLYEKECQTNTFTKKNLKFIPPEILNLFVLFLISAFIYFTKWQQNFTKVYIQSQSTLIRHASSHLKSTLNVFLKAPLSTLVTNTLFYLLPIIFSLGNLSIYTKEEAIYELFSRCGQIKLFKIGLNKLNNTPCGFCFVE